MSFLELVSRIVGGINYAAYQLNTLTYRAAPIEQRQQIIVPRLVKNKPMEIDLKGFLEFPLLLTGLALDIPEDDEQLLGEEEGKERRQSYVRLLVQSINRKTGLVESKIPFYISSYPPLLNDLILNPESIYRIETSRDINKVIFTGIPIHLRETKIFLDSKVIE